MSTSTKATIVLLLALLPLAARMVALALGVTGLLGQFAYKVLLIGCPILWRRGEGHRGFDIVWPIRGSKPSAGLLLTSVGLGLLFAGGAIAALSFLLPFWGIEPQVIRAALDERFAIPPSLIVPVVLFLTTVNAATEELHFRAWVDRTVSGGFGDATGILTSALLFGLVHGPIFFGFPGIPVSALWIMIGALLFAGICWSVLARRPGGIHGALLSHCVTDALLLGWGLSWLGYV